jgi:hypothetical protein
VLRASVRAPQRSTKGDPLTAQRLSTDAFATEDVTQLQILMTQLIDTCAAIGRQRDAAGAWQSAATGAEGGFAEAREVIEQLSRSLNRTRRAIRKIDTAARARRTQHRIAADVTWSPR